MRGEKGAREVSAGQAVECTAGTLTWGSVRVGPPPYIFQLRKWSHRVVRNRPEAPEAI